MLQFYENKKPSVWSRLEQNSDIDELIYGDHPRNEHDVEEEISDK